MRQFLLCHRHEPGECAAAYAAWLGFDSPLRHRAAPSTCLTGGHAIWWLVSADDEDGSLALLPRFVAERTSPLEVRAVHPP